MLNFSIPMAKVPGTKSHIIMDKYVPGVCNIGKREREFRRKSGYLAAALGILLVIILLVTGAQRYFRLVLFIPVFTSAVSLLQDRMHFCAELGMLGAYNFEDKLGRKTTVTEKEFINKDRLKALQIIFLSFVIGLIVTFLFFILP